MESMLTLNPNILTATLEFISLQLNNIYEIPL